ncbi:MULTISPECIES: PAS domain-containing protein [Streptomyces]|uniref:PAS domain-containing protein n=1 Tax=Streptomyces pratisoli TaxID=3139917 RepID=A0ACC6QTD4_9ACTN|nr:PAS domain-containing protein [Streptomyces sp. NBC_00259]
MAGKKPAPTDLAGILQRAGDVAGTALGSLLTRSALGFAIWDTDLRCIWVNDALEKYDGVPREQRLGRRPGTALPGDAGVLESAMREVLATGISDFGREYRAPIMERAGGNRAFSVCAIRLDDAEGRTLGVCAKWSLRSPADGGPRTAWPSSARPAPASAPRSTSCTRRRNWPTSPCRCSPTT